MGRCCSHWHVQLATKVQESYSGIEPFYTWLLLRGRMAMTANSIEQPTLCVLDEHDVDRLLERLRAIHGAARADIEPELLRHRLVVRVNHVMRAMT